MQASITAPVMKRFHLQLKVDFFENLGVGVPLSHFIKENTFAVLFHGS